MRLAFANATCLPETPLRTFPRRPSAHLRPERRAAILRALEDGPVRLRALAALLALDRKTVLHHARVLQHERALVLTRVRGALVLSLPHQRAHDASPPRAPHCAQERVLAALARAGGSLDRRALEEVLHVAPRTLRHAMRALALRGEILRERGADGERVRIIRR